MFQHLKISTNTAIIITIIIIIHQRTTPSFHLPTNVIHDHVALTKRVITATSSLPSNSPTSPRAAAAEEYICRLPSYHMLPLGGILGVGSTLPFKAEHNSAFLHHTLAHMTGPAANLAKMQSHFIKQVSVAPQAQASLAHEGRLNRMSACGVPIPKTPFFKLLCRYACSCLKCWCGVRIHAFSAWEEDDPRIWRGGQREASCRRRRRLNDRPALLRVRCYSIRIIHVARSYHRSQGAVQHFQ
jgi:hypothetical protein